MEKSGCSVPTSELEIPAVRAASVPGTTRTEMEIRPEIVVHPKHTRIVLRSQS